MVFLLVSMTLSGVSVGSSYLGVVCPGGRYERMQPLSITVNGNDMPDASAANPYYLRITLPEDVSNASTVKTINSDNDLQLAMRLALRSEALMVAPRLTATVARWQAGEHSIWIKFTTPTSEWLEVDGIIGPPSEENPVYMTISVSASESSSYSYSQFLLGLANGAVNEYDDYPADTRWLADLSASSLDDFSTFALASVSLLQNVDGVETAADPSQIEFQLVNELETDGAYAVGVSTLCQRSIFPWVTNNARYQSALRLSNRDVHEADIELLGTDPNGQTQKAFVQLGGQTSTQIDMASLFNLSPSFSLIVSGPSEYLRCQLVSSNGERGATLIEGQSPNHVSDSSGPYVLDFDFLTTQNATSAWVLVNASSEPTNATVQVTGHDGTDLGLQHLEDLLPGVPHAFLSSDIAQGQNVSLRVVANGQILGTAFYFNEWGDLAAISGHAWQVAERFSKSPKRLPAND